MTRRTTRLRVIAATTSSLLLVLTPLAAWSSQEEGLEFEEAEIFFELNNTDKDLGIHALIDGDAWKKMRIVQPNGKTMLDVRLKSRLKRQGLTELFFESAEPTFDELSPETFFERFPAGEYKIRGTSLEGDPIASIAELTQVMPAPVGNLTINGMSAEPDEEGECEEDELPQISNPIVIEWDAVTESHPELGAFSDELEVVRYQAVAEFETDDEVTYVSSIDILPDEDIERYSVTVPDEFLRDGFEGKFEVLVREASFNQTAIETCPFEFVVE